MKYPRLVGVCLSAWSPVHSGPSPLSWSEHETLQACTTALRSTTASILYTATQRSFRVEFWNAAEYLHPHRQLQAFLLCAPQILHWKAAAPSRKEAAVPIPTNYPPEHPCGLLIVNHAEHSRSTHDEMSGRACRKCMLIQIIKQSCRCRVSTS